VVKQAAWDEVIFDYGGVLCYAPARQDVAQCAASNAFAVMASLLNTIYKVKAGPGFWMSRLSAIGTTIVVGAMMFVALSDCRSRRSPSCWAPS
jgi:hypothetical protein